MPGALDGLKVLDLSRVLAGPYAAQMLGDLGADVIKVERPGNGDDTRLWGPPWSTNADGSRGDASYYSACNRNKRSLTLNLHSPQGIAIAKQLMAWADVVIENYKTGDLARHGLDYPAAKAENPRLIWCSITGFGHHSPNAARAGYDFMIQAESGLMDITGEADGRPLRAGVAVADLTTGMMAATGILAALNHRHSSGQGQHIDMALFDVTLGWLANQATSWLVGGAEPHRMGNQHPSIVPYQDFATATRPIALAVGNDGQFRAFAHVAGHPEWAEDPDFKTSAARARTRAKLIPQVESVLKSRSAEEWLEAFSAAGVPAGPIASVRDALESPQAKARNLIVEQTHPRRGQVKTVAQPLALGATPPVYALPPPDIGEHSREILRALGHDDAAIAVLIAAAITSEP